LKLIIEKLRILKQIMDSFFRSSSSKSHIPSSSNSSDNVVNNEEICIMDQELNLQEWKLPSVPTKNIEDNGR
jgi:hypothetical protein